MGLTPGRQKLWLMFPTSSQPLYETRQALVFLFTNGEALHLANLILWTQSSYN